MAERFPLLTDEQVEEMAETSFGDYMADKNDDYDIALARAIESAARAPLLAEIERLTAERDAANGHAADALDLVSRIRWAVGDHGARMQPGLIEYLKQMRKQAEKRDEWEEALRQVEEEMPDGYRVTLEMSPGDWSLTATTDDGDPIRIEDYASTEQFVREAVEAAKEHHARKEPANG